jgi:hypothetical protein
MGPFVLGCIRILRKGVVKVLRLCRSYGAHGCTLLLVGISAGFSSDQNFRIDRVSLCNVFVMQ